MGAPLWKLLLTGHALAYTTCSFFTPTSITLSCSARTDVLSCSAGPETPRQIDSFFCQQTSSVCGERFFLYCGKYKIENSDICQCFFYPESLSNHPTVVSDNELEPEAVSAWPCSKMLWELLLHRAGKNFPCVAQGPLHSPGSPGSSSLPISQHLPTPLYYVHHCWSPLH